MNEKAVKLSVMLSEDTVLEIRRLAVARGITMTETIRQALGLQAYLDKKVAGGSKVLLERDGNLRQLVSF